MHLVSLLCVFTLLLNVPVAAREKSLGASFGADLEKTLTGSEYILRSNMDQTLIPVKVLGGVNRPGLYHVPEGTTLTTLISLSGGLARGVNTSEISLFRRKNKVSDVVEIDLEDILKKNSVRDPVLMLNDTVFIQPDEPAISQNTLLTIGLVSSVMGIVLSSIIIKNNL